MLMISKSESDDLAQVIVRVPKSDLVEFDKLAQARRISRADLIRECILEKISNAEVFA